MNHFIEINKLILQKKHPQLFGQVETHSRSHVGQFVRTKTIPSFAFLTDDNRTIHAYNVEDPLKDIQTILPFIDGQSEDARVCVFVGMGLGYFPMWVLKHRPKLEKIIIVEPLLDMFWAALEAGDMTDLLESDKVKWFVGKIDWQDFAKKAEQIANLGAPRLLYFQPCFLWREQEYEAVRKKVYSILNEIIASQSTALAHGRLQFDNRFANIKLLPTSQTLDVIKGIGKNTPAILVSAGPSLDQSLPILKKASGKCMIICADAALNSLWQAGIVPDFVTCIDFRDENLEKFSSFLRQDQPFELVTAITATPLITHRLNPRRLFLSFQENESQKWVMKATSLHTTVPPCSSVIHLSLGLAVVLNADPIVFIGHDLGYHSQKKDHAKQAVFTYREPASKCIHIPDIQGGKIETSRIYYEFKTRLEGMIQKFPRQYINATARGAHIEGTQVMPLDTVLDKLLTRPVFAEKIINEAVSQSKRIDRSVLLQKSRDMLRQVDGSMTNIETLKAEMHQIRIALVENKKTYITLDRSTRLPEPFASRVLRFERKRQQWEVQNNLLLNCVTELTATKIFRNEQMLRDQRNATNLYNRCDKSFEQIDFVMQSHLEHLAVFKRHISDFVTYIETEQAISSHQQDLAHLTALADIYLLSGKLHSLKEIADKLQVLELGKSKAYFYHGVVRLYGHGFEKAEELFEKALEADPALLERINSIRRQEARRWVEKVRIYKNNHFDLKGHWLYRTLMLAPEGSQEYTAAIELWQEIVDNLVNQVEIGQVDTAERLLGFWSAIQDKLPDYKILKAECIGLRSGLDAAIDYLNDAVLQENAPAEWMAYLARLLMRNAQFDKGLEALNKAVAQKPATAMLWLEIGDLLFAQKDYANASSAYEKCFKSLPGCIEALFNIGECHYRMGHIESARIAWESVLKKDPSNARVKSRLAEMD